MAVLVVVLVVLLPSSIFCWLKKSVRCDNLFCLFGYLSSVLDGKGKHHINLVGACCSLLGTGGFFLTVCSFCSLTVRSFCSLTVCSFCNPTVCNFWLFLERLYFETKNLPTVPKIMRTVSSLGFWLCSVYGGISVHFSGCTYLFCDSLSIVDLSIKRAGLSIVDLSVMREPASLTRWKVGPYLPFFVGSFFRGVFNGVGQAGISGVFFSDKPSLCRISV